MASDPFWAPLRDLAKPVGVARYVTRLVESLPADLKAALPSVERLEAEFDSQPPAKRQRRKPQAKGGGR